jgi:hypothetical protein
MHLLLGNWEGWGESVVTELIVLILNSLQNSQ